MAEKVVKRKHLEALLDGLDDFECPKRELEQYSTPNEIAADCILYIDREDNAIRNKFVLDLGCGAGKLALGCSFMGAGHVVGVDIDDSAIEIAQKNSCIVFGSGFGQVDFITCDIGHLGSPFMGVDTIIMNPPFGSSAVKREKGSGHGKHKQRSKYVLSNCHVQGSETNGPDRVFLTKASELIHDDGAIYMFHSSKAHKFLEKLARGLGLKIELVVVVNMALTYTYRHQKDDSRDIDVSLYKLSKF